MTAQNIRGTQNPGLPVFAPSEDGIYHNTAGDKAIVVGPEQEMLRIAALVVDCYLARGAVVFAAPTDGNPFDWEIILAGTVREFAVVNGETYTLRVEATGEVYAYLY